MKGVEFDAPLISEIVSYFTQTQVEDHEREVLRLTRLLDGERREKEEEAKVFHKKVNMALMIIIGLVDEKMGQCRVGLYLFHKRCKSCSSGSQRWRRR